MDLTTNGVVVTDAIKYVQGQMDHLSTEEKELLHSVKQEKEVVVVESPSNLDEGREATNEVF